MTKGTTEEWKGKSVQFVFFKDKFDQADSFTTKTSLLVSKF